MALVGVVCAPDPFAGSSHVTNSDQLDEWSQEAIFQTTVESLVALLDAPDRDLPNHSTLKLLFQVDGVCSQPVHTQGLCTQRFLSAWCGYRG